MTIYDDKQSADLLAAEIQAEIQETATDPSAAVTPGHPTKAGAGYNCMCGERQHRAATDPSAAQPATPGQALRMAADRLDPRSLEGMPANAEHVTSDALRRWAAELDAAPAAPRTYELPAEPPPEVTELWAADGCKVERRTAEHGGWWYRGTVWRWLTLVEQAGPLSTAPPAETEGTS